MSTPYSRGEAQIRSKKLLVSEYSRQRRGSRQVEESYKWNFCVLRFSTCDRVRIYLTDEMRRTRGEDVYVIVDGKSVLIFQDQKNAECYFERRPMNPSTLWLKNSGCSQ